MVSKSYLLDTPPPPARLKRYVDQQVMPAAIDAAAGIEAVLERLSNLAKVQPAATLCAAFGLTFLAARAIKRVRN